MVDSLIEDHEPGGIGGYDLSQNPRCGAYLGLSAFVLNQAGQYLSPDAVLSVRRDSVLTPAFDCRQAMLESILILRLPALSLHSRHTRVVCCQDSIPTTL